jgi:SAM-dependent methyltransferase
MITRCPACGVESYELIREHSVEDAAQHFVPTSRDPVRHRELCDLIRDLWHARSHADVCRCLDCGLVFVSPWVAGSAKFYNLVSGSDPHYPKNRWEFEETLKALIHAYRGDGPCLELLEVGAGDGAFLKLLKASAVGERFRAFAVEYDTGAVAALRKAQISVLTQSPQDLAGDSTYSERFSVICLFQTLEHMDDVHGLFRSLVSLLRPNGHVFVSVPNAEAIAIQEDITGFWDMPPNHIGRWTKRALEHVALVNGFRLEEFKLEPVSRVRTAWLLARYSMLARAYNEGSLDARANSLDHRMIRGPLKAVLALTQVPRVALAWRRFLPLSQWAHFVPTT